ncbi:hypothetical protein [Streptomyces purpurogeneiscleroticus]|uniref:hypothetical protein n=1 Tax=Streptomyces purpurogeneiscleroticus TaxID=68259 RepID=UPI001CBDC2AB|nr:hypothetical protein [Streptomyces purpurogeneiscleroticus]MBZ4018029.1 hypothetical protein [Streptomyces purpurogeneiscleroticus]
MELVLSIIAVVVAAAAYFTGGVASRRLRVRDLEHFYLERYWQLQERASNKALLGESPPPSADWMPSMRVEASPLDEKDEQLATLYLRMCDDEVRMRNRGLISDDTWEEWLEAMQTSVGRWPTSDVWVRISASSDSKLKYLRGALRRNETDGWRPTDPCPMGGWKRYLRGLRSYPWPFGKPDAYDPADWIEAGNAP